MSKCCPHTWGREFVTAQGAATGSAISGTDMCPDIALCKPKTPMEVPPPEPTLGAGDLIDGGQRLDLYQPIDRAKILGRNE